MRFVIADKGYDTPCWLWRGSKNNKGYGRIRFRGEAWLPHRLVYTVLVEPIPKGLEVNHKCRQRTCVNPFHLELMTHRENIRHGSGTKVRKEQAELVRKLRAEGKTYPECAEAAGLSTNSARSIIRFGTWLN